MESTPIVYGLLAPFQGGADFLGNDFGTTSLRWSLDGLARLPVDSRRRRIAPPAVEARSAPTLIHDVTARQAMAIAPSTESALQREAERHDDGRSISSVEHLQRFTHRREFDAIDVPSILR